MHFVQLARSGHMTVPAHQQMCHTSSLTSSLLPPPPPPAVTTHFPSHYHRQPVASVQEHATQCPRNPETAPRWPCWQQHDNTKRGGCDTSKTQWTWWNTQGGARRGQRGMGKQRAGHTRYTRLFFLFFSCLLTSPLLLAPPPPTMFQRHPHPIPSFQTTKNTPSWVCSSCLGTPPPPTIMKHKNTSNGAFFMFCVSVPSPPTRHTKHMACFMCLVAHLLLPTSQHKKCTILGVFFMFGAYSIPLPSNTKNMPVLACFQCLTTSSPLSLYSIPLPSLLTPSLPFPILPFPFFFLFRYFLFR